MHIVIAHNGKIPASKYGGTERVVWWLGKALKDLGHQITFIAGAGAKCSFARIVERNSALPINEQIPADADLVHFHFPIHEEIIKPYVTTIHGNSKTKQQYDLNTIFISHDHATRHGSSCFVYNGIDFSDYQEVNLKATRNYFHFLANASWRVKNVKGAISLAEKAHEKLHVLGGNRINFNMGFRFTFNTSVRFFGMVDNEKKCKELSRSKGLLFPVLWHEPFGLAVIESLYFGCPVFATPYGSLKELVIEEAGMLSFKSSELVEGMRSDNSFDKQKCHEYACDCFNSVLMAKSYLHKYAQVLNGKYLNAQKPALKEPQKGLLKFD